MWRRGGRGEAGVRDSAAVTNTVPAPPAPAGIVCDGDEGRLSEAAFLRDFAGDLPEAKAKVLYAVQEPFHKALLTGKTTHAHGRQDQRSESESPVADIPTRRDYPVDPGSRRRASLAGVRPRARAVG